MNLDLTRIKNKSDVKNQVGQFIVEEILLRVAEGKSPLKGTPKWKKLNSKYANKEKGGSRNPNLELEGDLLDALEFKSLKGSQIEIGIFKKAEQGKADGHNNFSGESKLPLRRFIPKDDEKFYRKITKGVNEILEENRQPIPVKQDIKKQFAGTGEELGPTGLTLDNILSETTLNTLIGDILGESES